RQSRGQQGIGISAAGMYGQLTTGFPTEIISRTGKGKPAHRFEIFLNTQKNAPEVLTDEIVEWPGDHGTQVTITLEARYSRGGHTVDEYLKNCAVANPHARFVYRAPDGAETVYERATEELPKDPKEIRPHPYGVELGLLQKMLKSTKATKLKAFLEKDFSRVSASIASEICEVAGLSQTAWVSRISREDADRLYQAIPKVKIRKPPTDCLAPIGKESILAGLRKEYEADFYTAVTRDPAVYRGNPFLVEVGIAFGGKLPGDEPVDLIRFANRVPLLYQQSACAIAKAVVQAPWRNYGIQQSKDSLPIGPLVVFCHFASVWVPFTSESKEAIASYPEILKELKLALQECGRDVGRHISRRRREADAEKKKSYIELYLPHVGIALAEILGLTEPQKQETFEKLVSILERSRKP
ncbi:MAG: DNA topoisomerase VI subunit B, partial [Planctomycetes bacterium]|nr:DNA topoisomerase VI subunit B [Planctomycetota bacterium]